MGFLLWIRKPRIKTPPPLACFSSNSAYFKLKGLSHAYSVVVLTVNCVRQKKQKNKNGRTEQMMWRNVPLLQCIHGPENVTIKRDSGWRCWTWSMRVTMEGDSGFRSLQEKSRNSSDVSAAVSVGRGVSLSVRSHPIKSHDRLWSRLSASVHPQAHGSSSVALC